VTRAVLCCAVLCCAVLCCAVLWCQIRRPSNYSASEAIALGPVTPDPTIDTSGGGGGEALGRVGERAGGGPQWGVGGGGSGGSTWGEVVQRFKGYCGPCWEWQEARCFVEGRVRWSDKLAVRCFTAMVSSSHGDNQPADSRMPMPALCAYLCVSVSTVAASASAAAAVLC